MALLDRETLLKKQELKIEKVMLGEKDFVFVRQMCGRERDRFENSIVKRGKGGTIEMALEDFRAKLAVQTVCDEAGNNLLNTNDYDVLSRNMSADKLEAIINKAQEINKISDKDKEDMVKNLEGDPVANSTSDSAKS